MGSLKVLISPKVICLFCLFMVLSIISAADAQPPPVTEATLHQIAASLQMYVDELPQIPKLLGYTPRYGAPKPGKLTIGMYKTTWVREFFISNTSQELIQV